MDRLGRPAADASFKNRAWIAGILIGPLALPLLLLLPNLYGRNENHA
jgi:hypothetical protein